MDAKEVAVPRQDRVLGHERDHAHRERGELTASSAGGQPTAEAGVQFDGGEGGVLRVLPAAEGGRGEGLIAVFALACLQETEEVSSSKKQDSILRPSLQYASKSSSFTSIKSCAHRNFTIP